MKLSWLKLHIDILDDQKIKIIRKMPAGPELFMAWIGLLCLAMKGKDPGRIEIDDGIPYSPDDLANHWDMSTKTVQLALSTFCRLKMIELEEGGTIEIINFRKHQSLERIEQKREMNRIRVKKHRENQQNTKLVTHYSVTGNATDLDKDLDLELDKEKEKRRKKKTGEAPAGSAYAEPVIFDDSPEVLKKETLFDRLYAIRKKNGTLPMAGEKAESMKLYSPAAKKLLAEIESRDGLDFASDVFAWAAMDKWHGQQIIIPAGYTRYKAAYQAGLKKSGKQTPEELKAWADSFVADMEAKKHGTK